MKPEKAGIYTNIELALETVPGESYRVTLEEAVTRNLPIGALFSLGEYPRNVLQILKQANATARTSFEGSQVGEIRSIADTDATKGLASTKVGQISGAEYIAKFLESQKEQNEITQLLRLLDETENPNLSVDNINGYTEAVRLKNRLEAITDRELMELYLPALQPIERLSRLKQIPSIKSATLRFLEDYLKLTPTQE